MRGLGSYTCSRGACRGRILLPLLSALRFFFTCQALPTKGRPRSLARSSGLKRPHLRVGRSKKVGFAAFAKRHVRVLLASLGQNLAAGRHKSLRAYKEAASDGCTPVGREEEVWVSDTVSASVTDILAFEFGRSPGEAGHRVQLAPQLSGTWGCLVCVALFQCELRPGHQSPAKERTVSSSSSSSSSSS